MASRPSCVSARALRPPALAFLACVGLGLGHTGLALAAAPTVPSAGAPVPTGPGSEQVSAQVNPGGLATMVQFNYGATTSYGASTSPTSAGSGSTAGAVTGTITSLIPGDTYHVQAVASNSAYNDATGPDQSFVAGAPAATTGASAAVSGSNSSQVLDGLVNSAGTATTYYFQYGSQGGVQSQVVLDSPPSDSLTAPPAVDPDTSSLLQTPTTNAPSGTTDQAVQATVTGLAPGTYDYDLVAVNANGTVTGVTNTFTVGLASATTGSGTQTDAGSEIVSGSVDPTQVDTAYSVQYGLTPTYGSSTAPVDVGSGNATENEQTTLTNLSPGSTYYYRAVATTAAGPAYGAQMIFTLSQSFAVTAPATYVGAASATLNGSVGPGGLATTYYFQYGTDTNYGQQTSVSNVSASASTQSAVAGVTGLTSGTTYHYRLVVSNASGTYQGADETVTPGLPQIAYAVQVPQSDVSVTVHGWVNPSGLATTVQYQVGTAPGTYGSLQSASSPGSGTSAVDVPFTFSSLTPATVYYYRAVAANTAGTTYGAEQSFTSPAAPSVGSAAPAGLVATAVQLNGTISGNGYPGTYSFQYATAATYASNGGHYDQPTPLGSLAYGATDTGRDVSAQVTGLSPGTTYHYALVAVNGVDTVSTADATFTTAGSSVVPAVDAESSTGLTDTTATLQASLNPNGQDTQYSFEYGVSGCSSATQTALSDGSDGSVDEPVSANVTGLTAGTAYTFCVVATNATGTIVAAPQTFTTLTPPSATTGAASSPTDTTVTLAGSANPNGVATQVYFQYGTTLAYGQSTTPVTIGAGTSVAATSAALANLISATTYDYRLVATNGVDTTNGPNAQFTTLAAPQPPSFVDSGPSALDDHDATLNAAVNPNAQSTTWIVAYGTTNAYGSTASGSSLGSGSVAVAAALTLTGLVPDTIYHYQIRATNQYGTTTEVDHTFITLTPPTVSTAGASGQDSTTSNLNGTVNPNGFATNVWFQYGLTTSYGQGSAVIGVGAGTAAESEFLSVGSLAPSTVYHYRLVASNGPDTTYGADQTFSTTGAPPPTASTETTSALTSTGVTLSATLTPNGQSATYQFQYGTDAGYGSTTPTQALGATALPEVVAAVLVGLAPGTTYHFRVVATNASGTTFGSDDTFTTVSAPSGGGGSTGGGSTSTTTTSTSITATTTSTSTTTAAITGGSGSSTSGGVAASAGPPSVSATGPAAPTLAVLTAPSERIVGGKPTFDTGVRVQCPLGGPSCSVSVPLSYVVSVSVPAKGHHPRSVKHVTKTLATASLSLQPGKSLEATVRLSAQALAIIVVAKHLKATANVDAWASGGRHASLPVAATLTPTHAASKRRH